MEQKIPEIVKESTEAQKKPITAVAVIKWAVLALVVALAAVAVIASVQYSRYVTTTQKGTVIDLTDRGEVGSKTLERLRKYFPDALIRYNVEVGDMVVACDETALTLTDGQGVTVQQLADAAQELPWMSLLDMTGCSLTVEEYEQLRQSYPDAQIKWLVPVLGGLSPDTAELKVSDMASMREVLTVKQYLPRLARVDMSSAYLTDAEQQELTANAGSYGFAVEWSITVYGQNYSLDTTSVTLTGEHITDLTELYRLPMLKEITLDGVGVTDLTALTLISGLESITLKNMSVDGIAVLGNLRELGSFFVKNTNVTYAQLNELQRSLPECIVMMIE